MATTKITKVTLDNLHPGERDKFLWDEKLSGFGVKVTPKGRKVFLFQYRLGGRGAKVRRYTIGRFGAFTAEQARREAERLSRLVAQGTDPQTLKVERHRAAVELAFSRYVELFDDGCLKVRWRSSAGEVRAMLDRYAVAVLKDKPLPDVSRRDVQAVLDQVSDMQATASKLFAVLRRLFNFAISRGDLSSSPLAGMEAPRPPKARDRVLEDWELLLVWKASDLLGEPFAPWVKMLVLTGARREEVAGLNWKELNQGDLVWNLPADRAKNEHAYTIPLSSLTHETLQGVADRKVWPKKGLLFSTTGKTPVSGYSRAKGRLDKLITKLNEGEALDHWTWHDLRRTLATGMQRLGVRFEVTEAIVNHVSGSRSGIAGVYQRHDWGPEKRAALQAWSDHIESLLTERDETNVVQLADARA